MMKAKAVLRLCAIARDGQNQMWLRDLNRIKWRKTDETILKNCENSQGDKEIKERKWKIKKRKKGIMIIKEKVNEESIYILG